MSKIDLSMKIAIEFLKNYRLKYKRYLYSVRSVKDSKWWVHFEKASTFISYDDVVPFLEYIFTTSYQDEKILPHFLNKKYTKDLYETFIYLKNVKKEKTNTIDRIENTLRYILIWCKKNNIKEDKIVRFLEDRSNIMKIERNTLYEPVFYFSKKYMEDKFIEDLNLKKAVFKSSFPKVYDVLKKISLEDFLE